MRGLAAANVRRFSSAPECYIRTMTDAQKDWTELMERKGAPTLVQCGAEWCGSCQMIKPKIKEAVRAHKGAVEFLYVDIDEYEEIAGLLELQNIPIVYMVKDGEIVGELPGYPKEYDKKLEAFISNAFKEQ